MTALGAFYCRVKTTRLALAVSMVKPLCNGAYGVQHLLEGLPNHGARLYGLPYVVMMNTTIAVVYQCGEGAKRPTVEMQQREFVPSTATPSNTNTG